MPNSIERDLFVLFPRWSLVTPIREAPLRRAMSTIKCHSSKQSFEDMRPQTGVWDREEWEGFTLGVLATAVWNVCSNQGTHAPRSPEHRRIA